MQTGPCGDATVLDSGDAMVLHGRWKSHEGSENDKKEEKSSKSEKKSLKKFGGMKKWHYLCTAFESKCTVIPW